MTNPWRLILRATGKPILLFGDRQTEIGLFCEAKILRYYAFPFGSNGDIPAPGDYDGDGKSDAAVFRSGTWYVSRSTSGLLITNFGIGGDYPAPAAFVP